MDNMQLWLSSSTDSINLNDRLEGFYLNPDLDGLTGLPEIRSVNGLNAGYDGGWTATQLWAARLITIRGVIAINDKAAVETKRKALAKLLSQGKNEDLELKFVSEAGNTYTATVRTTNCTMALQRVFWRQEYQIQLRANDPLIYDDGGSELVAILRVMSGEGGFEIPFDIPFDIGGTVTPTSVDVGDEATYPLIRLKGDLHNPTIISLTTNQRMQVLADIITTIEWHGYTTAYTTNGYTQINSTEDGAPLSLTHLYGNATQQTYSGKNLMPIESEDMTSTRDHYLYIALNAGTYTISYDLSNVALGTNPSFAIYMALAGASAGGTTADVNISGEITSTASAHKTATFTITGNSNPSQQSNIRIAATNWNNGARAKISNIQIEAGSIPTTYEPYCGGIPSPNPDFPQEIKTVSGEQTVQIVGKNLFDKDNIATLNNYYVDSTGKIVAGSNNKMCYIKLSPSKTYTLTQSIKSAVNTRVAIFSTTPTAGATGTVVSTALSAEPINATFATTDDDIYLAWVYYNSAYPDGHTEDDMLNSIQLELGSTATTYEPYQAQSQEVNLGTIELAKIGTYQDYIWNDDGTWKIHKEVGKVDLGTLTWVSESEYDAGQFRANMTSVYVSDIPVCQGGILCSHFTWQPSANYGAMKEGHMAITNSQAVPILRSRSAVYSSMTADDFKTAMSGIYLYYQIYGTPTDTEITDSELIEQLNHIYSLYGGQNNLGLIPNAGAQGEMTVTYATAVDRDYHEVVIDCQARTVTQDGRNLYPALADGSEFIRLLPGENRLYLTSEVESDNGTAEVKFKKGNISI